MNAKKFTVIGPVAIVSLVFYLGMNAYQKRVQNAQEVQVKAEPVAAPRFAILNDCRAAIAVLRLQRQMLDAQRKVSLGAHCLVSYRSSDLEGAADIQAAVNCLASLVLVPVDYCTMT